MRRLSLLALTAILVSSSLTSLFITAPASALSGADWRAGRIIEDTLFTAKDSMSVGQIQAFLDSKVGTGGYASIPGQCDNNGVRSAQPFSSQSRADYARSLGRSDKFTCLNGYYEVPKLSPGPDAPASNYGGAPIPPGAKSAAQLIWDAAQRHNISPKVLLVTIEKESAGPLTRDDWPFQKQYTYAMGAHCPDSGPGGSANCDTNWSGFSLQIDESAALFRWYLDNMQQPWWSYKKPYQTTYIQWDVSASCGGSNVYIENMATAALYTYTPYQPNATALSDIYGGQDDGCSAYGNRNFWRIYNDLFGRTVGDWVNNNDGDELINGTDLCKNTHGAIIHGGCQVNATEESNSVSGDFNGDGFGDVLAFSVFPDGRTFNIWLFPGSANGLGSPVFQRTLGPGAGGWLYANSKPTVTDVNNDNYDDLVIFHRGPNNEIVRHTLKGSASGIQATDPALVIWQFPAQGWRWDSTRIVGGGDFNGDGFGDVLAFSVDQDGYAFASWTYLGSASGLQEPSNKIELKSDPGGWLYANSKPTITDVNNDNYDDLVIFHRGPNNEIVRHVLKGSAGGVTASDPNMVTWQYGSQGWLWDKVKIVGGGDFNGDGYGDVLAFSSFPDNRTFNVWLFTGSVSGVNAPVFQRTLGPSMGGWLYGSSKPSIADVDNDGFEDLVIFHRGPQNEIVRHVLKGSAGGIQASDPNNVAWQLPSQGWLWDYVRVIGGN